MAKEIIMPKFGFTQEESELLEWLYSEGDTVEKGDPIAVVSTDKISMEVEAPETGILSGIRYKVGDIVPVTKIIAFILQPGETLPKIKEEEKIQKAESVLERENRISISPVAMKLVKENSIDIDMLKGSGPQGKIIKKDVENFLKSNKKLDAGKIRATPAAKKIGRDREIDLSNIAGSGPRGRIQAEDVGKKKIQHVVRSNRNITVARKIPMIGMRRTIAQNMKQSWNDAPHMTLQIDIPMDELESMRKDLNLTRNLKDEKISLTAMITKAVAIAICRSPIVNSQYSDDGIKIIKEINIGIATALDDGLIVPVVQMADQKDINHISKEIKDLSSRAKAGKLNQSDLNNGTFTITNLGMYGVDRFTAIINPPQSAILAVGKMNRVFVPTEENLPIIQKMITFTLCADHRVMDGAQAARFLSELKSIIMEPKDIN